MSELFRLPTTLPSALDRSETKDVVYLLTMYRLLINNQCRTVASWHKSCHRQVNNTG